MSVLQYAIMPPESSQKEHSFGRSVWEWVKVIAIALIVALPIRFFIAEPFVVNGASMDPTFDTGQFLIVDRLTYDFEKPQRGDVIVFKYPGDTSIYYIKRIIGLPGETVIVKDGQVGIKEPGASDTIPLAQPYVDQDHASHDSGVYPLGKGQYFVMGDNRAQSSDSRAWGPLNADLIVGRPIVRITPFNKLGILPGSFNYNEASPQ
ncbi:MAG: signal peptidase I [Patescibacteria group bacterium]|nr:signal peptidase I [Patescibacteria group bacterium]